ncbi:cobalamin (vitamin B12) biosynthesis CbiM protein [Desulfarculus baarsii DSM 2075]|uniref:Cobalamin (Vitamin B12) biosynthesis CbiM protein n=1 Tax=Desulfarculus baarsii (strain ATCC 33931 / DSM 2075 / LMG 7858 / VKM B-1802 / 2st14) TaxID=644282 RepID=E1QKE3_DESB2|nr:cobalt transporter CbiM [Desulfarculus baarsii]ADK86036.1 cobalamin (vitamin B12) biosynthesis CbiM protein [Desulfarculus baarsii DSM 2075]
MHISEGVLSAPVLASGAVLAATGVAMGLARLDYQKLPRVAVLSAAFFVASLIHVPVGPVSVHLVLNGVVGLLLGWAAFPSILVALALQAILMQFGGLIVLGVNTFSMAMPAVICHYLFRSMVASQNRVVAFAGGALAGALAVALAGLFVALALFGGGEDFATVAAAVGLAHVPIFIAEGVLTGLAVLFIKRVRPAMLDRDQA